jgi:hypothetical protein
MHASITTALGERGRVATQVQAVARRRFVHQVAQRHTQTAGENERAPKHEGMRHLGSEVERSHGGDAGCEQHGAPFVSQTQSGLRVSYSVAKHLENVADRADRAAHNWRPLLPPETWANGPRSRGSRNCSRRKGRSAGRPTAQKVGLALLTRRGVTVGYPAFFSRKPSTLARSYPLPASNSDVACERITWPLAFRTNRCGYPVTFGHRDSSSSFLF